MTSKPKRRPRPHRALDETEREEVLGALHCERFVDKARSGVGYASGNEGTYLCSIRTMYPSESAGTNGPSELHQAGAVGRSAEPGLVVGYHEASWPRQVDLLLPLRHPRHLLPLRGWLDAGSPRKCRARPTPHRRELRSRTLNPTSSPFTRTVFDEEQARGSAPQTSYDRTTIPTESLFKTKYCPQFPSRFGSAEDGRLFCCGFFDYYNFHHRHSGIGLMTPADVHYDRSSRTAHHRSAPDPSRSSTGSSRTLRSRNAATARTFAGLDQPAAGKNDPPHKPLSRRRPYLGYLLFL